jgi:hypothetical protein
MFRSAVIVLSLVITFAAGAAAQQKTVINDKRAAKMLLGRHLLSLQWISWDHFGKANVTNKNGIYRIKGEQRGRGNTDLLMIDGYITEIGAKEFTFSGKILTQISHINGGKPCTRDGEYTFKITGKRKYWRMQQFDNPCDQAADYVDLYLR